MGAGRNLGLGWFRNYIYALTNIGTGSLSAPFMVSGDKVSVSCPSTPTSLAPTAFISGTSTSPYMITSNDITTAHSGVVNSNTAAVTVTANIVADLEVARTDGSSNYTPGSDVTYVITVINHGPSANTGLTLTDPLPGGTTFAFPRGRTGSVIRFRATFPLVSTRIWQWFLACMSF